ncbi:MAG: hypothetical protein RLZZ575_152, partial [Actinomycetota bacterium]
SNLKIRTVALIAGVLAFSLTPFVQPGIPVLASVLIAIIFGLREKK